MEVVYMFFLLILCSLPSIASSSQSDTLKKGDALNSSALLVSANNNFTLGFFTPEGTNRTYLAIQCRACDSSDPVWIGNRETPLPTNSSATLQIDASGRLLILTHDEGQGNSYLLSPKQTSRNVTATLLDSGNFVLREVNSDGEELWSSFDHPTDTLLPGMKLGVNHRTGRNWSLTSWQDDDIPAAGAFSLEWEPTKRRLVLKNRGVVRWTSGELMNATDFQHITINSSGIYKGLHTFDYVNISTKEEESFRYAVTPLPDPFLSPEEKIKNRLAGWKLDTRGALFDIVGGMHIVDVGNCYGYENETQQSIGCELWEQPSSCRGGGETFEERRGTFYTENGLREIADQDITPQNSSGSPSDCRENCWSDCACVGYRSYPEGRCGYWRGTDLKFEQDLAGNTPTLYVLIRPGKGKPRSKTWIWILIPTAISTALVVLLLLRRRRRKREEARKEQELKDLLTLEEYSDIHELSSGENGSLKVFSYAWVITTTNNFSSDCKLGQGGFGSVYKAWELWNKDAVLQLVDPSLISNLCGNEEQLRRCINVGLLCVEDSAVDRPSMADVVSMFTNENLALPKPKKPAFVSRFGVSDTFQDDQSRKFTVNELSISTMEAR
nr:G-type lectin S-receptor-like serine/threonine-protein kinase At1g67520 [Ipomoea batatas]